MASVIKNFGLFWERDSVSWGRSGRGNQGELLGYNKHKKSRCVDFRHQAGVYILYEGTSIPEQRVSYVGQAGRGENNDLYSRLKQHRNDHLRNRWQRFSWFGLYAVGKNDTLVHTNSNKTASAGTIGDVMDHLEGILISLLEPTLNRQGARWQSDVEEYIQSADSLPGEQFNDIESKLDTIIAHLEKM